MGCIPLGVHNRRGYTCLPYQIFRVVLGDQTLLERPAGLLDQGGLVSQSLERRAFLVLLAVRSLPSHQLPYLPSLLRDLWDPQGPWVLAAPPVQSARADLEAPKGPACPDYHPYPGARVVQAVLQTLAAAYGRGSMPSSHQRS